MPEQVLNGSNSVGKMRELKFGDREIGKNGWGGKPLVLCYLKRLV